MNAANLITKSHIFFWGFARYTIQEVCFSMTEWLYCSLCSLCSLAGWIFSICLNHSFGGGLSIWFVFSGGVVPRIGELWNWFAPVPCYDKCHDNSRTAMSVFSEKKTVLANSSSAFLFFYFIVISSVESLRTIFLRNLSSHYNVNVRNHSKPRPLLIPVSLQQSFGTTSIT